MVVVTMEVQGTGSITELVTELGTLEGVLAVTGGDAYRTAE